MTNAKTARADSGGFPASIATDATQFSSPLGLRDLLDALGYRANEFIAVCHQPPGGDFRASVMPTEMASSYAESLGGGVNVWFSVNPTTGPPRDDGRRGTAEQTTRLAALFADLDVKPGACADLATAEKIIDELSSVLGQRPSVVVSSGHGLQPYWPVDDGDVTAAFTVANAAALLRRVGRLVALVAEHQHAAVDNVFDLARVLRVPGSVNLKGEPVPVTACRDVGGPLTVAEITERLDEIGVSSQPDDRTSAVIVSDPNGWTFATQTCSYVATIIDGLSSDAPRDGGGRNPWACSQAVRLCCAQRLGCITEADFRRAIALLEVRLAGLLATTAPRRALRRLEMRDVFRLGRQRAACKTDNQAAAELGGWHVHHNWQIGQPPPGPQAVALEAVQPPATTWEPIDLGPYLRGEVALPKPSIGIARSDGPRLLYAGREHAVIGETESGKTWLALQCVAAEMLADNAVVYVHYEESNPASTVERLKLLGVGADIIARHLRFVAPSRNLADVGWMAALLVDPTPTLVVHDGVNEAMALHGLDMFAADGAAQFRRVLVSPGIRAGAAVLSCDHLPKNRDGQGRDAYGSVHKGNALDGARFVLENVEPFGRGLRGASNVFVTKDRPGHLREHGRPSKLPGKTFLGTLVADATDPFKPFSLMLFAPKDDETHAADATAGGTALADAVHAVIVAAPDRTVDSSRKLFAAMRAAGHTMRDGAYRNALDDLMIAGRLEEVRKGRSVGYRAIANASEEMTP